MASIAKLGHVALVSPDVERSLWFWRDVVGLEEVEQDDGVTYLRGWGEFEHHSLSLREGPTGVDHVGWRAGASADVEAYAERLSEVGVSFERVEAGAERGQGEAIRFSLPGGGHPFEIYFDVDKPLFDGDRRSRLKNQTGQAWRKGISPRRIDHINAWCANPRPAADWMADELGFKHREQVELSDGTLVFSWMAVTSLVHDIALGADPGGQDARFHHVAYYLDNWQDVLRAMDILAEQGIEVDLGPGRHGISQAFFCYVKDPGSGHRLELFSGGYHIFDPDWEPVVWREGDMKEGLVWWGEQFLPGTGHVMDDTTPC